MTAELTRLAGIWRIDPERSEIAFRVRHLGVRDQRGTVRGITGELFIGVSAATSSVTADIALSSVSTGMRARDKAIRSHKLLDVETHPTASYRSTQVRERADGHYDVEGELTFLGVTQPVELTVSPLAGSEQGFTATAELHRPTFGFRLHEGPSFLDRTLGSTVYLTISVFGTTTP